MTQQPQYPQYGPSQPSPQGPVPPQGGPPKPTKQPAPKKHTTRTLVLTGVGALVLGLVIGSAGSSTSADDAAGPQPTVTVTVPNTGPSPDPVTTPTNTPPPPAPKVVAPTVKDFKLTVKTLTKQCFGSAGCNVTFRILVAYSGPALDPGKTYEVLYTVKGGEDPVENKLTVSGGESSVDEEEMVSTSKSSAKLTAVVTDVMES